MISFLFNCGIVISSNLFVSVNGSDSNNGTESSPYLTISHALNNVTHGDSIFVSEGSFNEPINMVDGITLLGSGIENTELICGSGTITLANNVSISNFKITADIQSDINQYIIEEVEKILNNVKIKNNFFEFYGLGILNVVGGSISNLEISNNSFTGSASATNSLIRFNQSAQNIFISDNIFSGINHYGNLITFMGNQYNDISDISIEKNHFLNISSSNWVVGIDIGSSSNSIVSYNLF